MVFDQEFGSPIVALCLSQMLSKRECSLIAYGLQNGNFGLFELDQEEAIVLWEVDHLQTGNTTPITFVQIATIKSREHMIVMRDDGSIELYQFDEVEASQMFKAKEEDTITGLVVGNVTSTR